MSDKPPFTTSMKASSCGNISSRKTKVHKINLESRDAIAHMESLRGRTSPEFQKSPVKKPVDSPNNQLRSSFEFVDVPADKTRSTRDLTTIYMTDYCSATTSQEIF